MKQGFTYAQMGLSILSVVAWLILPVFSFVLLIPLFNIIGWNLAFTINQIMLIPLLFGLLMLLAAFLNNRSLMITSAILQIIMFVLTIIFRKQILLGGNIKWIYTSAQLLLGKVKELAGLQFDANDLNNTITFIIDNYMQVGLGMILHGFFVFIYAMIAIFAPQKNDTKKNRNNGTNGTDQQSVPRYVPTQQNTGYKHRT